MMHALSSRTRRVRYLLLAAGAGAICSASANAQWTAINLHPAGAESSVAKSVHGVSQVGSVNINDSAVLWSSSASSALWLNPAPTHGSLGHAVLGGVQAGYVAAPRGASAHAALWSGTPQSWIDIHPAHATEVIGTIAYTLGDGGAVGGTYFIDTGELFSLGRPCMWTDGTAASWVDLLPAGYGTGEVLGMSGNQQVGATYDGFLGLAGMWNGSAASFVDLNPAGAFASSATCTDGTHQYGAVGFIEPAPAILPVRWSGTAGSWENMGTPEGWFGGIGGTHGGWHAGSLQSPDATLERATVWTGGPGSYVDLHDALPAGYTTSAALGIWRHMESGTAYVVGWATNAATEDSEAMMWVTGPGVNLITSAQAPADCSATPGDSLVYTGHVINAGAEASGPVTVTVALPPASVATFAGSTPPPIAVSPTEVTIELGSLAPTGGSADLTVTLTAAQPGGVAELVFSAAAAGEVHAENNAAVASSQITPTPPTGGPFLATALVSTDPASDTSLVPGLGGARFTSLGQLAASPSGDWWAILVGTDLDPLQRHMIIRTPTGGTPAVVAQYGVTATSAGVIDDILPGVEVNDAGLVAFGGADNSGFFERFVATTDGATLTEVARHGQAIPAMPGETYGPSLGGSVNIFASGATSFRAVSEPSLDAAFLSDNGATLVARRNTTTPDGAEYLILELDDNIFNTAGCQFDATGAHSIYSGRLSTGDDAIDRVIVADGFAIMQEGVTTLPGMEYPVADSPVNFTMSPGGVWMVRGANADGEVWVARGEGQAITRIFRAGEPIHAGAAETWQVDHITPPFFVHTTDAAGNFVIGGTTSNPDDFADTALVYNDQTVIARENDPIDLDGNGVFDDGFYIRSIESNSVVFVPGAVLFKVTLRDEDGALCGANDESRGQAIVRVGLPGCPSDWNDDGSVNSGDISSFLTAWIASVQAGDLVGDFNTDGATNSGDISAFLTAWIDAVTNGC